MCGAATAPALWGGQDDVLEVTPAGAATSRDHAMYQWDWIANVGGPTAYVPLSAHTAAGPSVQPPVEPIGVWAGAACRPPTPYPKSPSPQPSLPSQHPCATHGSAQKQATVPPHCAAETPRRSEVATARASTGWETSSRHEWDGLDGVDASVYLIDINGTVATQTTGTTRAVSTLEAPLRST